MSFPSQPPSKAHGGDQSCRSHPKDRTCWLRAPPGERPKRGGGSAACKAISLCWV